MKNRIGGADVQGLDEALASRRTLVPVGLGVLFASLSLACGGGGYPGTGGEPGASSDEAALVHSEDVVVGAEDGLHRDPSDPGLPKAPDLRSGDAGSGGSGTVDVTVEEPSCDALTCSIDIEFYGCMGPGEYIGGESSDYSAASVQTFAIPLTWKGPSTVPCLLADVHVDDAASSRSWYGEVLDRTPLSEGGTASISVTLRPLPALGDLPIKPKGRPLEKW